MTHGSLKLDIAAAISLPSWIVSLAADTLPLVQWIAGFVAIVVGVLAIWRHFRK